MNYEEMLSNQEGVAQHQEREPWGTFYKKQIDRKYRYVVDLRPELADSLIFCEALRRDHQQVSLIDNPRQLRYELREDSGGLYELEITSSGSYQPLSQLLAQQPAIVATPGFIDGVISDVVDMTKALHEQGIFHVCYAPETLFVRKGDNVVAMLCHGSSFLGLKDPSALYAGFEDMVAPEVLSGDGCDERSDVYGIGRLIAKLFESSVVPGEYKGVVKKATSEDPSQRYSHVEDIRSIASRRRGIRKTVLMALAALAVAGLLVWAFFGFLPEPTNVEFVDNNGLAPKDDPFAVEYDDSHIDELGNVIGNSNDPYSESYDDEYLDPDQTLFLDSITPMTDEEVRHLSDSITTSQAAERIFQRQFERAAKAQLTPLYKESTFGLDENDYIAKSNQVIDGLMGEVERMSQGTGLPVDRAMSLASQIISQTQHDLMDNVMKTGSNTKGQKEE